MLGLLILVLAMGLGGPAAFAQMEKKPPQKEMAPKGTIASIMDQHLGIVERQFVSAAEAMPEDKYSFAPTNGEFKGVRTFAEEVKHVASANYQFFSAVLGEKAKDDGENGPDSVKTKDDILKYLKDSFALGHRAIATITEDNATTVLTNPSGEPEKGPLNTRVGMALIGIWHPMDHYGQMVEYLRMNGIIPPASRPRQ
jgi:uncharacterized damage-inducible protein DinB